MAQDDRYHPARHIKYQDQEADIDLAIASLILNLWKLDIHTMNSCEDNVPKGFVWIEFVSVYDAERFLDIVAKYSKGKGSVYGRITGWYCDAELEAWIYNTHVFDYGVDEEFSNDDVISTTFSGQHQFQFSMSIGFPRRDLRFVKKQISKALVMTPKPERIA
jgi:hypothetical protein